MVVQTIQSVGLRMSYNKIFKFNIMEIIEKGQCGERVSYELYEDGTLKIFGVGEMYNYQSNKYSPFYEFQGIIKKIIVSLGVTSIGNRAFFACGNIDSIDLPDSISTIGSEAFLGCNSLKKIIIPNSVTTIKSYAFSSCSSLMAVKLSNSIVSFPEYLFAYCTELQSIEIPNSVTTMGAYAFKSCTSLSLINIPDSITKIGYQAFDSCCALDTVKIGKNATSLSDIFKDCNKLTNITVDECNEKFSSENGVLYNKNKSVLIKYPAYKKDTEFIVPESVIEIDCSAFAYCRFLEKITITKNVKYIRRLAFEYCESLRILNIEGKIDEIGGDAFSVCRHIFSITVKSEIPSKVELDNVFNWIIDTARVCVPDASIKYYKAARGWNRFTNYVAIEDEN